MVLGRSVTQRAPARPCAWRVARMDVRLPPAAPVRDEAERAVALPGRLAHRFAGAARDWSTARRPPRGRRGRGSSGSTTSDDASHGMSGWSHTTTASRPSARVRPGCAEEVVPGQQRRFRRWGGRGPGPGRERDHAPGGSPVTLFGVRLRTASTQSPSAVALSPPWRYAVPAGAGAAERTRRRTALVGTAVAEPHPLVRLVHVGEGAGGAARHETHGAAAVLVHPAADAHAGGRVVARGLLLRLARTRRGRSPRGATRASTALRRPSTARPRRSWRRRPPPPSTPRANGRSLQS